MLCGLGCTASAQNIYLDWAASVGGTGFDIGRAVALDAQGNAHVTGFFQGSADFDPGAGISMLTSAGDNDVFVQKLDAAGSLLWARRIGGATVDEGKGIALDAAGNVYVTGRFSGTVDFDPGSTTAMAVSVGFADVFILKLDVNGNFVWFRQMGAAGSDEGTALTVDASGVYTIGYFQGTMDIDPTAGSELVVSTMGTFDIFIQRLDDNGDYVWGKRFGADGLDYGFGITVGLNGHVFATGCYQGTTDFDPDVGVSNLTTGVGATSAYVLSLDTAGVYRWVRPIGAADYCIGYAVSTSNSGALFITGGFNGTNMDFDPSGGTNLKTSNAYDVFVQKLDADGGYHGAWTFGGLGDDYGYAIDVTPSNEVYFTGGYGATVDFDPSPSATYNITSFNNTFDMYIERMDTAGNFIWARSIGGGDIEYGFGLAADGNGHVLTTGCYGQQVDFDTEAGVYNLSTSGAADIFVHQLKQCAPSNASMTLAGCDSLQVNAQTFYTSGTFTQTLTNATGCDSTLTLQLSIGQTTSSSIIDTACFEYTLNGFNYDSSGTYVQTLANATGCDSVLTLALTVNTVDTSVSFSAFYIVANTNFGTFQWLDCYNAFSPVPNGNTASFFPNYASSFAVQITQNGCIDTSNCYLITLDHLEDGLGNLISILPNPTQRDFRIVVGESLGTVQVEIHDALGKLVWQGDYENGQSLHLDGPKGLYFVTAHTAEGSSSLKLLKE